MTWTATLVSVAADPNNGNLLATIRYTADDGRTFQPPALPGNGLTDDLIKLHMARIVNVLQTRDTALAAITLKPGTVDVSDVVLVDPDAASNQAYAAAINHLNALNIVKAAVTAGNIQSTDPVVARAVQNYSDAKSALSTATAAASISLSK